MNSRGAPSASVGVYHEAVPSLVNRPRRPILGEKMIPRPKTTQELLNEELTLIASGNAVSCNDINPDTQLVCMRIRNHAEVGLAMREAHANKSDPNDDSTWVSWV